MLLHISTYVYAQPITHERIEDGKRKKKGKKYTNDRKKTEKERERSECSLQQPVVTSGFRTDRHYHKQSVYRQSRCAIQ
mgnify:CR=1 FL=1